MKSNYSAALRFVLVEEGGYSDHPADPGGATMKGITQATYDAWRRNHGQAAKPVRGITQEEVEAIYRRQYADVIRFDDLPQGIDYCLLDYAVNSGTGRAIKVAQRIVGETVDGSMGEHTLQAIAGRTPSSFIAAVCDERLRFLRSLKTWAVFGKGWGARVARVRRQALMMLTQRGPQAAAEPAPMPDIETAATPKADPADIRMSARPGAAGAGLTGLGVSGSVVSDAAEKLSPFTDFSAVLKWVFIALLVAGVGLTLYEMLKHSREAEA